MAQVELQGVLVEGSDGMLFVMRGNDTPIAEREATGLTE
jgi:hypothetical protein